MDFPLPGLALDAASSAPILFFLLGAAIAAAGAKLPFPDGLGKALAVYLLVAIGLKGGVALSGGALADGAASIVPLLLAAALLSFAMPLVAFGLLRAFTPVDRTNAAAIAAHYGSVSLVTFVAATEVLKTQGIAYGGHMVAALAVMEGPAVVSGLLLAGAAGGMRLAAAGAGGGVVSVSGGGGGSGGAGAGGALREAALNGSVLMLMGALAIGFAMGKPGMDAMSGLFVAPWTGVLCLFLLDMGYLAAARLKEAAGLSPRLVAFGLGMPLVGAGIGLSAGMALGLGLGDLTLLTVLCASASYIAVPAALRHALPDADPGLSLPLAMAVTFPFNVLVGIPLYLGAARLVAG